MFENVDGRPEAGVTGILIAHPRAFRSGELKPPNKYHFWVLYLFYVYLSIIPTTDLVLRTFYEIQLNDFSDF